jgi:hypothetical protein
MTVEVMEAVPTYTQRRPPEWDLFVEQAERAIQPGEPYGQQQAAIEKVWDESAAFDDGTLDAVRYYGIGLVVCELAKQVYTPAGHVEFIGAATRAVVNEHDEYCHNTGSPKSEGLYAQEIRGPTYEDFSKIYQVPGYAAMPVAERLVVNTLTEALIFSKDFRQRHKKIGIEHALEGTVALESVLLNTLSGASALARNTLLRMYEHNTGQRPQPGELQDPPVKDIVDAAALKELDISAMAAVASGLRYDEFQQIDTLVCADTKGNVFLNRSKIANNPPVEYADAATGQISQAKRLRCPAIYVGGAIAFAAGVLPEVLAGAQQQLLGQC